MINKTNDGLKRLGAIKSNRKHWTTNINKRTHKTNKKKKKKKKRTNDIEKIIN